MGDETTAAPAVTALASEDGSDTLDRDVPCAGCGYNLRGLSPAGLCPECGFSIPASLPLYEARRASRAPPDPAAARAGVEGAVLSLLAYALMWVPAAAPAEWFFFPYSYSPSAQSPGRVALLSAASAAWVLAWYAAWKLTKSPSDSAAAGALTARGVARWGLTLYAIIPFLLPLTGGMGDPDGAVLAFLTMLLCGGAGDAGLFMHLADLLRRYGRRGWAAQATFLAVANPAAMWFSMFIGVGRGGISSLDQMLTLPVCPYGVMYLLREFLYVQILHGELPHLALAALVAAGAWPAALLVRLIGCLHPYRPAAGGGLRSVSTGVTK